MRGSTVPHKLPPRSHKYGVPRGGLGETNNIRRVFLSFVELLYDSCFELTYKIQKRKERDVIVRWGIASGGNIGGGVIYLRGKTVYFYRIASVRDALANEVFSSCFLPEEIQMRS